MHVFHQKLILLLFSVVRNDYDSTDNCIRIAYSQNLFARRAIDNAGVHESNLQKIKDQNSIHVLKCEVLQDQCPRN